MSCFSIFQLNLLEVLDPLQSKFASKEFQGQTNYEDFVRYLHQAKAAATLNQKEEENLNEQLSEFEQKKNRREQKVKKRAESGTMAR